MSASAKDGFDLDLDRDGMLALGLLTNSHTWLEAAKALLGASRDRLQLGADFIAPISFLALQCLECSLKSFLHARGIEEKALKHEFRHDLLAVLAKAKELGIEKIVCITPEMTGRLEMIAPLYVGKSLQYFQRADRRLYPMPIALIGDVELIHDALDDAYRDHARQTSSA